MAVLAFWIPLAYSMHAPSFPNALPLLARADQMRHHFVTAAASKLKEIPPPAVEPGVVAFAGSALFMGAGLGLRCAPRVAAGLLTAVAVSAPVQILDIAIMENASGKRKLPQVSLSVFSWNPSKQPFAWFERA
jgi:hypothetical protein